MLSKEFTKVYVGSLLPFLRTLSHIIDFLLYVSHILGENLMSLSLNEIQKIETRLDTALTKIRNKKVSM